MSIWKVLGIIGTVFVGLVTLIAFCNVDLHFANGEEVLTGLRIVLFILVSVMVFMISTEIGYDYLFVACWLLIIGMIFLQLVGVNQLKEAIFEVQATINGLKQLIP